MKFPWSDAKDPLRLQPGTYAVEVTKAEEKVSSNNNPMWLLSLRATEFNAPLCQDNLMLAGGGINISKAKLKALGFAETDDVEAGHLLGKRCWVTVKQEPYTDKHGNERMSLRVDIDAKGSVCGYWKEKPGAVMEPLEIPF